MKNQISQFIILKSEDESFFEMGDEDQIFNSWGSLMGASSETDEKAEQQNEAGSESFSAQRDVKQSCNLM